MRLPMLIAYILVNDPFPVLDNPTKWLLAGLSRSYQAVNKANN